MGINGGDVRGKMGWKATKKTVKASMHGCQEHVPVCDHMSSDVGSWSLSGLP